MDKSIAEIAGKLSEAQREWLLLKENRESFWCSDRRTWEAIERKGLVCESLQISEVPWTPLGLAVRAHLNGE